MSGETNLSDDGQSGDQQGLLNTMTSITRQRVKLNIKVLGVQLGSSQDGQQKEHHQQQEEGRRSYREQFVAPEMSIISKLMSKVCL